MPKTFIQIKCLCIFSTTVLLYIIYNIIILSLLPYYLAT